MRRFLICFAIAAVLICIIVFSCQYFRHTAAEEMLANFNATLQDYPKLPASFVSNICFLEKGWDTVSVDGNERQTGNRHTVA